MHTEQREVGVAVIGCGRWGPNHLRVFSELSRARVLACADPDPAKLERPMRRFRGLRAATDYRRLLDDRDIDAVVIATPTRTHFDIAYDALRAGKHVLVEKPLCLTGDEGRILSELAAARGLVLMVGQVFLFNRGIMKLRDLIVQGELGLIHYLDAVRTNLGPIRGDVNALYDLAAHDISIFNYLMGSTPFEVSALGSCISQPDVEDVCFVTLKYPDETLAHVHVSWLNPRKVRTLTVVGSQKMAHWDDMEPTEPVRLYDKGLQEPPHYDSFGEFQYALRSADVHLPAIQCTEPLVEQAEAFLDSVLDGAPCRSGALEARAVVAVLEAATESLGDAGRLVIVKSAHRAARQTQEVLV